EDAPRRVVGLFGQAYDLDRRAEYLVLRAFARSELSAPDLDGLDRDADAALGDRAYAGGHALKGFALLLRSRGLSDYAGKLALLRQANDRFAGADKLFGRDQGEEEELSAIYRYWSTVCLELGNYCPDEPGQKRAYIDAAIRYARKATRVNPRNLDAWDALA